MIEYMAVELQEMFDEHPNVEARLRLDVAVSDLENIYKENFPFQSVETTNGQIYIFTRSFIYKCLVAFATDSLQDMGEEEIEWFNRFIDFENIMSTNPPSSLPPSRPFGCTHKDANGKSYVVLADLSVTTIECTNPTGTVESLDVLVDLDRVFIDMYNVREMNRDRIQDIELVDISKSGLDKIKDIIT